MQCVWYTLVIELCLYYQPLKHSKKNANYEKR